MKKTLSLLALLLLSGCGAGHQAGIPLPEPQAEAQATAKAEVAEAVAAGKSFNADDYDLAYRVFLAAGKLDQAQNVAQTAVRKLPGVRSVGFVSGSDITMVQLHVDGSKAANGVPMQAARLAYRYSHGSVAVEIIRWRGDASGSALERH